ncbi:MAG: putative glutamine amidotransferase [Symbiobacteriaceae bacterium]|jgi:putative glutamine amidotransferase|nr:putative glutamine amidotransferase [Symbiobacteriaceae bacterium]
MAMKPLIGITADGLADVNRDGLWNTADYFRAVQAAGGMPVLLPYISTDEDAVALLDRLDGILFSGGPDVDPLIFGEQPHEKMGTVAPERDQTELILAKHALERDMPILGICRGHQLLAVAEGGTLWQDIPAQKPGSIKHGNQGHTPKWYPTHTVAITEGTTLSSLFGAEVRVNSRHHQAVKAVPAGWVESGVAADGINEAMEKVGARFCLSVQWHPENFTGKEYNFGKLFAAFVAAAGGR